MKVSNREHYYPCSVVAKPALCSSAGQSAEALQQRVTSSSSLEAAIEGAVYIQVSN